MDYLFSFPSFSGVVKTCCVAICASVVAVVAGVEVVDWLEGVDCGRGTFLTENSVSQYYLNIVPLLYILCLTHPALMNQ